MNKKAKSVTGVFLMEMIMVVFFFILCASTCILVFVKADNMSRLAKDTNRGVMAAESMAEIWKAEGTEGLIERLNGQEEASQILIYWDRAWNPASEDESAYIGSLKRTEGSDIEEAQIEIIRQKDEKSLFIMNVARLRPADR